MRTSFLSSALIAFSICGWAGSIGFNQTNLVSDIPGLAANTDPNLINPWGVSFGPTSPFWVANNGSGTATLYNGAGAPQALVVSVPGNPTGTVFNGNMANFGGAFFLFAGTGGIISSWAPADGVTAVVQVDNSTSAAYTGLTIAGNNLYAANFRGGAIQEFDSSFAPVSTSGFVDPNLPAGFAPFDVQNINGDLYVTYAPQDRSTGAGLGFVDVYDPGGTLLSRLISGGALNAPWGLAVAPAGFGSFGGDLLVGNFGNGMINAFDINTGAQVGTIDDASGMPVINQGLWTLTFGNGALGQGTGTLFLTAGIPGPGGQVEENGLFASLDPVPEPSSISLAILGLGVVAVAIATPVATHFDVGKRALGSVK